MINSYAVLEELATRIHPLFGSGSPPSLAAKQRLNWAKLLLEPVDQSSPAASLDVDVAAMVGACLYQSVRDAHGRTMELAAAAAAPFNVTPSMCASLRASETSRRVDVSSNPARRFHEHFATDTRYEFIKKIGDYANGPVGLFRHSCTKNTVAVRKITRACEDRSTVKRTLRELLLLRHMSHHNLIGLIDVWPSPTEDTGHVRDVYVVTQSMDTDLHQIIRSKQELTDEHAQYFMYQLFCGLKFMHSAGVL
eukprot:COSAG06_NODE_13270_length_1275_cov_1.386905_1_plen_250_part_10